MDGLSDLVLFSSSLSDYPDEVKIVKRQADVGQLIGNTLLRRLYW